jgi:TolA-binding protein
LQTTGPKRFGPALREHLPRFLRMAVSAFSNSSLPPVAARALNVLLEGAAASATSTRALRQLEQQVGTSQTELGSQLRLHDAALKELHGDLDEVRVKIEQEIHRQEAQSALFAVQLADLRRLTVRLVVGTGIGLLLLLSAVFFLVRR